ncbi:MAG: hypothetical protein E5299_01573 [Burkholderia gladioli]|nr:MAG: hypothetical protein E5299_01573 [Burkholderia gladioli]
MCKRECANSIRRAVSVAGRFCINLAWADNVDAKQSGRAPVIHPQFVILKLGKRPSCLVFPCPSHEGAFQFQNHELRMDIKFDSGVINFQFLRRRCAGIYTGHVSRKHATVSRTGRTMALLHQSMPLRPRASSIDATTPIQCALRGQFQHLVVGVLVMQGPGTLPPSTFCSRPDHQGVQAEPFVGGASTA